MNSGDTYCVLLLEHTAVCVLVFWYSETDLLIVLDSLITIDVFV